MPVQHHGPAAVVLGPRVPDRQPELVRLPRRVPVQRERADPARRTAVIRLLEPGVRDDQPAAVQHVVADEPVEEPLRLSPEPGLARLPRLDLAERLGQPVAGPDVAAAQRAQQLGLVVAGHRERAAGPGHPHGQRQHTGRVRAAVDQVTQEHSLAPRRVRRTQHTAGLVPFGLVAEQGEQLGELVQAAVHVADHVERPGLVPQVVEHPGPGDDRGVGLLRRGQHPDVPEALPLEAAHRPAKLVALAAQHLRPELPVRPLRVALRAHRLGHVQHDRHRQHIVLAGRLDQLAPVIGLHVRRVHDGQPARGQPLGRDVIQHVERVPGRGLVVLVVGDEAAAEVGGEDFGGREVAAGECRLAGSGHAHERDQGQLGDGDLAARGDLPVGGAHGPVPAVPVRANIAIWVGEPTSGSSPPTGRSRTA